MNELMTISLTQKFLPDYREYLFSKNSQSFLLDVINLFKDSDDATYYQGVLDSHHQMTKTIHRQLQEQSDELYYRQRALHQKREALRTQGRQGKQEGA